MEHEKTKLKKFLAEQMLDAAVMKVLLVKMAGPTAKREAIAYLQVGLGLPDCRCGPEDDALSVTSPARHGAA